MFRLPFSQLVLCLAHGNFFLLYSISNIILFRASLVQWLERQAINQLFMLMPYTVAVRGVGAGIRRPNIPS